MVLKVSNNIQNNFAPLFFIISRLLILFFLPTFFSDTVYYEEIAKRLFNHELPYIDFLFEYPPLAILQIYLPGLLTSFIDYRLSFMLFAFIPDFVFFIFFHKNQKGLLYSFLTFLLWPILLDRLDLLMCFFMFFSVYAFYKKKTHLGIILSSLGGWQKLIPFCTAIFLPAQKNIFRSTSSFLLLNLFILTLLSTFFYSHLFSFLGYHTNRPLQIETFLASFALIANLFFDFSIQYNFDFGSYNLIFAQDHLLMTIFSIFFVLLALFVTFKFFKSNFAFNYFDLFALYILLFLVFTKVFSTQFLLWPIPFLILGKAQHQFHIIEKITWALALFISTFIFINYQLIVQKDMLLTLLLFLRNIIICYMTTKLFYIVVFSKEHLRE